MGIKTIAYRLGRTSAYVQTMKLRTYMESIGWVRSRYEQASVDRDGAPRAWLVYPAIQFLEGRVPAGIRVFEWGSGASTLWWQRLGCEVVSIEHDADWAARHAAVIHRGLDDGYVEEISKHGLFDIVLVDGRRRVDCVRHGMAHLTERGALILDNCDRPEYEPAIADLMAAGFRFLPLYGFAPGGLKEQATGIFYRDDNVLQL